MLRPLLLALAALLLAAPAAHACTDQPRSKPFTPWLDYAWYEPAPPGWTFNGATAAPGGQPWGEDDESLAIPAGANAVSDRVCITPAHPTLRFFARGTGTLAVSVLALGGALELPVGVVLGTGAWSPSPVMPIVLNLLGDQHVRFRSSSVAGSFRVDDLWIDPYSKG